MVNLGIRNFPYLIPSAKHSFTFFPRTLEILEVFLEEVDFERWEGSKTIQIGSENKFLFFCVDATSHGQTGSVTSL